MLYFRKDGNYTVKSGYARAMLLEEKGVWGGRLKGLCSRLLISNFQKSSKCVHDCVNNIFRTNSNLIKCSMQVDYMSFMLMRKWKK